MDSDDDMLTDYSYSSVDSTESAYINEVFGRTPQEREMDQEYHQQLVYCRTLRFLRRDPETLTLKVLKKLSSLVVSGARTNNRTVNVALLPAALQQLLAKHLTLVDADEDQVVRHFEVVSEMLTPRTSWLTLVFENEDAYQEPWQGWSMPRLQLITDKICSTQNQLGYLEVKVMDPQSLIPSQVQLQAMVMSHSSSLLELRLAECNLTNATLRLIAGNCLGLEILDVSENAHLTGRGLDQFLSVDHCGLKRFYCRNTKISLKAIAKLVVKIQATVEFVDILNENNSGYIWVRLQRLDPNFSLTKYEVLKLDLEEDHPKVLFNEIKGKVPNVSVVHLEGYSGSSSLSGWTKLRDLTLYLQEIPQQLDAVLRNLATTLEHLKIHSSNLTTSHFLDVNTFASCLNLKTLKVTNLKLVSNNYEDPIHEETFGSLTTVELDCLPTSTVSDPLWVKMLSSVKLEWFETNLRVPEQVMLDVISSVSESPQVLGNLKTMILKEPSRYQLSTWCQFLCVCANSTHLVCKSIARDADMLTKLGRFVLRNSIGVHIEDNIQD